MKRRYYEITPPAEYVVKRRIEMGRSVAQNNAETLRLQKKRTDRYLDLLQLLEYDPVRTERRIQAAANTFEMALTVTEPVFPERPPMAEEVWMCGCMEPCYGYDYMDKDTTFTLACAIWMLDQLKKCGRLAEAAACFPEHARRVYAHYEQVCVTEEGRKMLRHQLWQRYTDSVYGCKAYLEAQKAGNKEAMRVLRIRFAAEMTDEPYYLRGANRWVAQERGLPTVYNRLAILACSVFALSHWRTDIAVKSYLL